MKSSVSSAAALAAASAGDEIWVAEGTYRPTANGNRTASFALKPHVSLYGGFFGNETSRVARRGDPDSTVLSGDIGTLGDATDNSYHVLTSAQHSYVEEFKITGGHATGTDSAQRAGGGLYNVNSSVTVRRCLFVDNHALGVGGGVQISSGNARFIECRFIGNSSGWNNGGAGVGDCAVTFYRCVFMARPPRISAAFLVPRAQTSTWAPMST